MNDTDRRYQRILTKKFENFGTAKIRIYLATFTEIFMRIHSLFKNKRKRTRVFFFIETRP